MTILIILDGGAEGEGLRIVVVRGLGVVSQVPISFELLSSPP